MANSTNGTITGLRIGTTYFFAATAVDSLGLESDFTKEIVYTLTNGTPPAVALTSPSNGASFLALASISLSASVIPNGHTINKIQFYSSSNLLAEAVNAP